AARRLLRLLLRDGPDLRRQEVDPRGARAGAGLPRARHLRRRHADRRADRGQRVHAHARWSYDHDPGPLAQLLGAPRRVRGRGPDSVRAAVPGAETGGPRLKLLATPVIDVEDRQPLEMRVKPGGEVGV